MTVDYWNQKIKCKLNVKKSRDKLYFVAKSSKTDTDWKSYQEARNYFKRLNRSKIINYFEKRVLMTSKIPKNIGNFIKALSS
jgi:hypothetical protein